jgi:bacillithiol biosynthesis cysteine-adding enzyme BshC
MLFTKRPFSIQKTKLFSSLFENYIQQDETVKPFYKYHLSQKDFEAFFVEEHFNYLNRPVLVESLLKQSQLVTNTTSKTIESIRLFNNDNTFSVTTGHQLCLFSGPLYFIYKIISAINLCKTLTEKFPNKNFVPVYWMASEDHDFEEINHANVFGKKIVWNSEEKGSVGNFKTKNLADVIVELKTILGDNENATHLTTLFEDAYLKNENLADATRFLVNELFGEYGLITLDGNDKNLKGLFKEELKTDVFKNTSFEIVSETINQLKEKYSAQVSPRLINVFYTEQNLRERIELKNNRYHVLNTEISFSKEELEDIIDTTPEKLSPNVVLRPLYQQKILPNIAYVGGPGELAYWLEYKKMFEAYNITFPVLMPRNFAMIIDKGTQNKIKKLNLETESIFTDGEDLVKAFIKTEHADVNLNNFNSSLNDVFNSITELVSTIDKSLIGSVEAEKQKALNGILALNQKINKALKQKSETDINQIWAIKSKLFPNNMPQERYDNFSMYYTKYGKTFIENLVEELTYNLDSFEYTVLFEN